jgi:hypothetical protein
VTLIISSWLGIFLFVLVAKAPMYFIFLSYGSAAQFIYGDARSPLSGRLCRDLWSLFKKNGVTWTRVDVFMSLTAVKLVKLQVSPLVWPYIPEPESKSLLSCEHVNSPSASAIIVKGMNSDFVRDISQILTFHIPLPASTTSNFVICCGGSWVDPHKVTEDPGSSCKGLSGKIAKMPLKHAKFQRFFQPQTC